MAAGIPASRPVCLTGARHERTLGQWHSRPTPPPFRRTRSPGGILALLVMASGCAEPARLERYDDGALARVSEWDGPLLDGRDLRLHEDGSPDRLGSWVQGRRTGLWLDWAPGSELIRAEEWQAGVHAGAPSGVDRGRSARVHGALDREPPHGGVAAFGAGGVLVRSRPTAGPCSRSGGGCERRLARLETLFADLVPETLPLDPGVEP